MVTSRRTRRVGRHACFQPQFTDKIVDETPKTGCSFKFFGQIHASRVPLYLMKELEDEIDNPTGITTVRPPEMKLTGVLISKNCGILYELPDIDGLKCVVCARRFRLVADIGLIGRRGFSARSSHVSSLPVEYCPSVSSYALHRWRYICICQHGSSLPPAPPNFPQSICCRPLSRLSLSFHHPKHDRRPILYWCKHTL